MAMTMAKGNDDDNDNGIVMAMTMPKVNDSSRAITILIVIRRICVYVYTCILNSVRYKH